MIFTSDHGEMLGDHGLIQQGCRFDEGLVRVPLIFSWPGQVTSGRRSEALGELYDLEEDPASSIACWTAPVTWG